MPRNWDAIAEKTEGENVADDFKQALYQLVTQQCLYGRFLHQRLAYRLISRFRADFKEAAELMGLKLEFVDNRNFCYVRQDMARVQPMDSKETMFLLALRHVYHVRASAGDLTLEGDAIVSLPDFQESYKALTNRDIDMRSSRVEPLMRMAQRQGLALQSERMDGDSQPFTITILPGIAEILSEYAINRFGAALKASLLIDSEAKSTQDIEEVVP